MTKGDDTRTRNLYQKLAHRIERSSILCKFLVPNKADQSNRTILVTCIGADFLRRFSGTSVLSACHRRKTQWQLRHFCNHHLWSSIIIVYNQCLWRNECLNFDLDQYNVSDGQLLYPWHMLQKFAPYCRLPFSDAGFRRRFMRLELSFWHQKINAWKWFCILSGALHCIGQPIKISILELCLLCTSVQCFLVHVHATFWLGIEQCSNRRRNLVPDGSGTRFAWHTYQKAAPEKCGINLWCHFLECVSWVGLLLFLFYLSINVNAVSIY